ncbi:C-terminal domain of homeodomain 1-domain-containing protein [Mycena metata]|uniref:C-terminal domain of homeodomain 1-domain-containing protein n=1 Tax=Mycena metata TaxID=1033252 RepID=A0AAD7P3Q7_9AGAR|nr:C-terminal domain of homeodomain 1-domain-containing protein [Mycena metata]
MSSLDIRERLVRAESEFATVASMADPGAVASFTQSWEQLWVDLETASNAGLLDAETATIAHVVASRVSIFADSLLSFRTESANITAELETIFDGLDLDVPADKSSPIQPLASLPTSSITRTDPSLPPYIEPAYKWLLRHLHNPYPKKEVKEKIADETGSSVERISDWFIDVRRRMGWTRLLREEFSRKRADMTDAAVRYFINEDRRHPLPPNIIRRFVEIEAFAKEMYAAKLVPSALSNTLTAAVKDLTPELQEKAREERWAKLQAQRDVAKLGAFAYPSPAPSGYSSPVSDNGASTSFAGRKRSSSEASDSEEPYNKRPRFDDDSSVGAFGLPSPPYSGAINLRKRRMSDADAAPGAKRPRVRAASDPIPVTVTLAGTPDILADWFTSDRGGDTNIFEPGQLLDIKFFDPAEYEFEDSTTPADPVAKVPTLPPAPTLPPPTSDSDTIDFDIPADLQHLFNFADFPEAFIQPPPVNLDESFASYPLNDSFGPIVYEAPSFLEPFSGSYDHGFITRDSVVESFGFESVASHNNPAVYSAFPDGKASGNLINGLFEQQHKIQIQNEYMYQQPVSY